jgi:hypothetical protein
MWEGNCLGVIDALRGKTVWADGHGKWLPVKRLARKSSRFSKFSASPTLEVSVNRLVVVFVDR